MRLDTGSQFLLSFKGKKLKQNDTSYNGTGKHKEKHEEKTTHSLLSYLKGNKKKIKSQFLK